MCRLKGVGSTYLDRYVWVREREREREWHKGKKRWCWWKIGRERVCVG